METKWIIKPAIDKTLCDSFPEYHPLVLQLLRNRGLTDAKSIDEFFNPDYVDHVHNPFLLKGMGNAVKRIEQAINKKEKILVYGDYDADGVTSTVLLVKTLKFLGARNVEVYIPDRIKEGYGLKKEIISKIKEAGTNLVITVDCGIASKKEIDLANKIGLDVIVTDHHWVPEETPRALAVINPKQKDDNYPFKDLAGVGVAFKLAQGLLRNKGAAPAESEVYASNQGTNFEKWLLDLVAIGTVADSVPLLGENRTLLSYGLIVLKKTKNAGLKELIKQSLLKQKNPPASEKNGKTELKITTEMINFQLAPRINAAGRLDHANTSFELLITESEKEARGLVESLELLNGQRQNITEKIINEVRKRISAGQKTKPLDNIIFEGDKDWPIGVLGLVAGKLSDEFSRPAFIMHGDENFSSASCRSIPSFNIIEALSECKDLLDEFGGHKGAAGFRIKNENIEALQKKLIGIATKKIKESDLVPDIEIDAELSSEDINWEFFREMEKLYPYGEMNPEPIFILKRMKIVEMKKVGNGEKHLKLTLCSPKDKNFRRESKLFRAIGFNLGQYQVDKKLKAGNYIDIVFTLSVNGWNGYNNLEFKVIDLKAVKN